MSASSLNEEIWQWVAAVPEGRVATYGQIARLAGHPNHARYVGSTLRQLPAGSRLPWHRILNSQGRISFPQGSEAWERQKRLLEDEGVVLIGGKVALKRFQWEV